MVEWKKDCHIHNGAHHGSRDKRAVEGIHGNCTKVVEKRFWFHAEAAFEDDGGQQEEEEEALLKVNPLGKVFIHVHQLHYPAEYNSCTCLLNFFCLLHRYLFMYLHIYIYK